jgi:hypothetical protein
MSKLSAYLTVKLLWHITKLLFDNDINTYNLYLSLSFAFQHSIFTGKLVIIQHGTTEDHTLYLYAA